MTRYPLDQLYEELSFVAYHFHWSHDDVLDLPHWERRRWCEEISRINKRMNADSGVERGSLTPTPFGPSSDSLTGKSLDLGNL